MKTLTELLELTNKAITNNGSTYSQWFINFSGHVNKFEIRYYRSGWSLSNKEGYEPEYCTINLNKEDSIQEGYWFIKNRL